MPSLDRRTATIAAVIVALLVLGGVAVTRGGGGESAATTTTTTSSSTTTTAPSTTTTTVPTSVAPLTGLPLPETHEAFSRPALAVKIDNSNAGARPQLGLANADVVFEVRVEGGVTRFIAVFHSGDANPIGPIRSFRTSDVDIVSGLSVPLFAWHGSNLIAIEELRAAKSRGALIDVGINAAPGAYARGGPHPAPHNSISNTAALFALAPDGAGPPAPLFVYGPADAAPVGTPVSAFRLDFKGGAGSAPPDWTWDDDAGVWLRDQFGTPHVDNSGTRLSAANVIVQFVGYVPTTQTQPSGKPVPEAVTIGEGRAVVFTKGHMIEATWRKDSPTSITQYLGPDGSPVLLTPGKTFVELPPDGSLTTTP